MLKVIGDMSWVPANSTLTLTDHIYFIPSVSSASSGTSTSLNFCQLEESINKWTLELEEQEKLFMNQATQVNAWDRLLIGNGEKVNLCQYMYRIICVPAWEHDLYRQEYESSFLGMQELAMLEGGLVRSSV